MNASAPPDPGPRLTSPEANLRRVLFRVLRRVEQQADSGIATVTHAGAPLGDLILSHGRLCLAIPQRVCPRDAGGLDASLGQLVHRSRSGGHFGTAALGAGRGPLERARQALLDLLVRNLCCMLGPASEDTLQVTLRPALDDYEPRLTFSPTEVLVACLARTLGPLEPLAAELLDTLECSRLLVLARGDEEGEIPYPIAARGVDELSMMEIFKLARTASDLCARVAGPPAAAQDVEAVSVAEESRRWHFVGGPRRVVAVAAERAGADESLSRAIRVAMGNGLGAHPGGAAEAEGARRACRCAQAPASDSTWPAPDAGGASA